jgi:hypothetical protein
MKAKKKILTSLSGKTKKRSWDIIFGANVVPLQATMTQ